MAQKIEIYNSLSKRSEKPVKELIGSHIKTIKILIEQLANYDLEFVRFQVSGTFQSTSTNPKYLDKKQQKLLEATNDKGNLSPNITCYKTYSKAYDKDPTYAGIGWHTVYAPINVVAELIKLGYCLRYGVKEGGNDGKENFIGCEFLAFDLDKESNLLSIEQTKEICDNNLIAAFMIHYSPSGSPECPKLRLLIHLDEFHHDHYRLNDLVERVRSVFPNATHADEPFRYFYGTLRPDEAFVCLEAKNNAELLEASLPALPEKKAATDLCKGIYVDPNENLTRTRARSIYIFEEIVAKQFNGDPTGLADTWIDHHNESLDNILSKGEWFDRGSQNGSLNSWNGTDPIRGSKTGQGDSFVISIQPDSSLIYCRDHSEEGSDLIELYYFLKMGSWQAPPPTNRQHQECYKEICKLANVEPKMFYEVQPPKTDYYYRNKLQVAIDSCVDQSENAGFYLNMKLANSLITPDTLAHAFYESREGRLLKLVKEKMTDQILFLHHNRKQWKKVGSSFVDTIYADWMRTLTIKHPDMAGSSLPDQMMSFKLDQTAKQLNRVEKSFRTHLIPKRDKYWVGFNDGAYNLVTREFFEGNTELKDCWVAFDWNYLDYASNQETHILDELSDLSILNTYPEYREVLRKLAIVTICGHLQLTGMLPAFSGQSGTMKTTFAKICLAALDKEMSALERDQKALEQAIGSHANAMLDDKVLLVLDELLPDEAWLGYFKGIAQGQIEEGIETTINEKGIPREQVTHYYGVIATWNDFIFKGAKIDKDSFLALKRRMMYFKTHKVEGIEKDSSFLMKFTEGDRMRHLVIECLREFKEEYIEHLANMEKYHPDIKEMMDDDLKNDVNKSGDYFFFQDCLIPCEGFAIPGVVLTLAQELYNLRENNKGKDKTLWDLPRFYSYMENEGLAVPRDKKGQLETVVKWKPLNGTSKDAEAIRSLKGMRIKPELEKKWGIEEYVTQGTKFSVYTMEVESTLRHMVQNFNSPIYYAPSPKAIEVN